MIQPLGLYRLAHQGTVHPAQQPAAVEPADRVVAGFQTQHDLIAAVAGPTSKTPEILGPLFQHRAVTAPTVFALTRKLAAKELKDEAFQEAATRLHQIARESPDALTQDLAETALIKYFKWSDNATDWAVKLGPVKGPTQALERMVGQADPDRSRNWFNATSLPPHLERLAEAVEQAPLPKATLSVLARCARSFARRAEAELTETIREHESPDDDRAWSARATAILQRAWEFGDLVVACDGRPVPLGGLDLAETLAGDLRLEVREGMLDFRTPRSPSPELAALIKKIPGWEKDPAPGVDELSRLALEQPGEAARLVAELVELQLENGPLWNFNRLLKESAERPLMKALLEPHGSDLCTLAERTADRESGNLHDDTLVDYYLQLFSCLPELATPDTVEHQLKHLGSLKLPELVGELCEGRPDLAAACARMALHEDESRPRYDAYRILRTAAEKGWEPQPQELQWIADRLVRVRVAEDQSILKTDASHDLLKLGATLAERFPGCWEEISTLDSQGVHRPVRKALLDILLNTPETDLDRYNPGGSFGRNVRDAYKWLSPEPDRSLAATLLAHAEKARPGLSLREQPDLVKKSIAMLGNLPLAAEDEERLVERLRPLSTTAHGHRVLNDIVDRYRVSHYEPEAVKAFQKPGLSLEERVEKGVDFVLINQEGFAPYRLEHKERMRSGLEAFSEALAGHSEAELTALCVGLVRDVNAEAVKYEKASDLPPRFKAKLLLTGQVASGNSARMDRFLNELAPLREKKSYGVIEDMLATFDSVRVDLDWADVKEAILARESLGEQADGIRAYLNRPDGGGRPHEALKLFTELVGQKGAAAPTAWMVQLLTPVLDGYGPGQTRTSAHAVEVKMAEELVGDDEERRKLYETMLDPFLLGPLGDDPVGYRLHRARNVIIDRSEWPLMDRDRPGEERLKLLKQAWRYAVADGNDSVDKLSRSFVTWRDEHDQHWSSKLIARFPDCKDNELLARLCLSVDAHGDPQRDLELFGEVFEKLNGPDRPAEILQGFERARAALEAGADRERALWHALIENLAAPGQESVAGGTIDAADDVVQVADFALDIRDF